MKLSVAFLAACAAVSVGALLALNQDALFTVSAQTEKSYSWLYENDELFDQLSGASRTKLEIKLGKKLNLKGGSTGPLRGKPGVIGGKTSGGPGEPGGPKRTGEEPLSALANPRVNDPTTDLTAQDTQSESALVLGSASNVVSAFNDSGSFVGGARKFTGFARSTDGSDSWTDRGTLPSGLEGDGGDPVLARSDLTGTVFLSTLTLDADHNLHVFRSTDDGQTFLPPANGAPGFDLFTDFQDKEWIAVDNFPGPGQGNVYMAWRNFSNFSPRNGITFTRSTDDGLTWGPSGGTFIEGFGQGAFVAVAPDHTVYVFWWNANAFPRTITMRKSTDQGQSFGPTTTVTSLSSFGVNGDLGLVGGFRTNSFPHVAVNPLNGNLYVAFNDRTGPDRANVLLTQSTDGGSTWSTPVRVNDDGGQNDQYMPSITVTPDGARLCVTFYDRRRDLQNSLIDRFGVVGSISGSAITFGPNFLITTESFPVVRGVDPVINSLYMGDYDMMAADNSFFYSTWGDNRDPSIAVPSRKNANVRSARIPVAGPGAVLAVAGTGLPTGGNGNGGVDPNECVNIDVTLRNFGSSVATGITATLSTTTPGVSVSQPSSSYTDIDVGFKGTNITPFQISTSPSFVCGTPIDFTMTVNMAGDGASTLSFRMGTASPNATVRIDNDDVVAIPDVGAVESQVTVSGITSAVSKVTASLFINHTFDNDLVIQLIGPDGTTVTLSNRNGGNGSNYGVGCFPDSNRTTFDDDAATAIVDGTAPFVGAFRPEEPLSAFEGKSGAALNGVWRLRVIDAEGGDLGAIRCWSLIIVPVVCSDGGGTCAGFPDLDSATIDDPNGNHLVDPNECFDLTAVLRNVGTAPMTGISATLSSVTPEVFISQAASDYPDLAVGATGANITPFKVQSTAAFACGTPVDLRLTVSAGGTTFIVGIRLGSGTPAGTLPFSSTDVPKAIPEGSSIGVNSTATVSGITGTIDKVTVSLHITHAFDFDLDIRLIGPDGTTIVLSSFNGFGSNYGNSCNDRTVFDDSAATSIVQGFPAFVGTFRPEEPLAAFKRKSGSKVNGTWTLRVRDQAFNGFLGTIQCWSLSISQVNCIDGGAVSISPTAESFPVGGGSGNVTVTATAGCDWTAVSNAPWITITSGSSGTGNGTVDYSVAANPGCETRMGTITIYGHTFTVSQGGVTCTLEIMPSSQNFPGSGGSGSVTVTATAACCTWTAVSNAPWIIITSGSNGIGSGTVNFDVAANPNCAARSGTMTIAGNTFTVNQDPHLCAFSLNPTNKNFIASSGTGSVAITASNACCTWSAVSNDPWIIITSGSSGAGNGTTNYSVQANSTSTSRTGTMTIAGLTFTVFQAGLGADSDADGIPDAVEVVELRDPFLKDNDIFGNARLFVMQQYRDFLRREGDAGGIAFWTDRINGGVQTRAQVIQSFFNSAEFQNTTAPVTRLFFAFFLRIPDTGGLNFWVDQFRNGVPLAAIAEAFAQSAEFQARYGSLTNSEFVTLVYNNVLGREPDPGGLAFWTGQLDSGTLTRGQVMLNFSESAEFKAAISNEVFVTQIYIGMLRRAPDQGGFDFWVGALDAGVSRLTLIQLFLDSTEYHNRFLLPI